MLNSQKTIKASRRYPILNTYVNALSLDETVAEVEKVIAAGVPTQHVVVNASKVNLMEADPKLAEIVNACPLINADGASIVWAAKKLGVPLSERVTGMICSSAWWSCPLRRATRFTSSARRRKLFRGSGRFSRSVIPAFR